MMLDKMKKAARIVIDDFDDQLSLLLQAGRTDLEMAGIHAPQGDVFFDRAIITYALAHFGSPANYQQLVDSYNTMKAQMMTSSRYTDWGDGT